MTTRLKDSPGAGSLCRLSRSRIRQVPNHLKTEKAGISRKTTRRCLREERQCLRVAITDVDLVVLPTAGSADRRRWVERERGVHLPRAGWISTLLLEWHGISVATWLKNSRRSCHRIRNAVCHLLGFASASVPGR